MQSAAKRGKKLRTLSDYKKQADKIKPFKGENPMTNETRIEPQPKLVWPFLAWNFGWTWGFMLLAIILKNLWPENPPILYLALEGL